MVVLGLAGCGWTERDEPEGPRVPPEVQRALPTHQYNLPSDVCPEGLGMPPAEEARTRKLGRRQLAALVAAYRRDPDAVVRTAYTPAHEPGIGHEDMRVRELLGGHLESARRLATEPGLEEDAACLRDVVRRLRAAKKAAG